MDSFEWGHQEGITGREGHGAFPQRQESTFQQEPEGSLDTVQAMMWGNNGAQTAEGPAASGRALFYSQALRSHRSIFREGNDTLQLSSETISWATVQRRDWGDMGCLGQISGISLQITQVRFSKDLNKGGAI